MNFIFDKIIYATIITIGVAAVNAIVLFEPMGVNRFLFFVGVIFVWDCVASLFRGKKNDDQEV